MQASIRKSVIAGSWYPGRPDVLSETVQAYLSQAPVVTPELKPVALISPHAGYVYSGQVAAHAYRTILGQEYDLVVVISPSHRAAFPFVAVWAEGGYETPLGQIPVDEPFCRALLQAGDLVQDDRRPHGEEHALEIQLPFLQVALGTFKLCPLIMGTQDLSTCTRLAEILRECVSAPERVLVVASSDLSHFHRAERAVSMDGAIERAIDAFDITALSDLLERGESEACGGGPILAAMLYARLIGHTKARVLSYAHSGHITGDNASVVGYLAAMIA